MWSWMWLACDSDTQTTTPVVDGTGQADVVNVTTSGSAGSYTFAVTVRSDDTGCTLYANWWEVLTAEGDLAYRRILDHSHTSEQPFTRTGGPVPIDGDTEVVVRAHMYPTGYRGGLLRGTVNGGFSPWEPPEGWAADVEQAAPQPDGCLF